MTANGVLQKAVLFIAIAIGVYVLHWARDFLMPLTVALLLADVIAPSVAWLRRRRVPNGLAVTLVTTTLAVIALGAIILLSRQVFGLMADLPNYRDNLVAKVRTLRESTSGPLSRLTGVFQDISEEFAPPATTQAALGQPTTAAAAEPTPVQIVESRTASLASTYVAPIIGPLGDAGVVFALVFFLLLERDFIGHRTSWLMRRSKFGVSSETINDATHTVNRFLRMQLLVNVTSGTLVGTSMWLIGLPNAILLGAIAGALRYIPYVGPLAGILLPTALAIAVFPDWKWALLVVAVMLTIELITNMVLEPLLYGTSIGASSTGVIVSFFFWAWVWGPIGLLIAMPLTVWIVHVGRYLPGVRPLAVVLSSEDIASVEFADGAAAKEKPVEPKENDWAE